MGNAEKIPGIFPRVLRPRIDRIICKMGLPGLVQGPGGARGSAGNEDANHLPGTRYCVWIGQGVSMGWRGWDQLHLIPVSLHSCLNDNSSLPPYLDR